MSIYDFSAKTIQGEEKSLSDYRGKVLLVVNVASKCGYTPQYTGLQALYEKYKDKGFEVLGFPCNQFGQQEPGTEEEIQNFCSTNYNVTFPMFSKVDVNGDNAHPLYTYLKSHGPGGSAQDGADIAWNFTKFLVGPDGEVIDRFESKVTPSDIDARVAQLVQ